MGLFDIFSPAKSLKDAVRAGKLGVTRRILQKGVTQVELDACIGPAVHSGLPMVDLLVQNGANVNYQNRQGRTPLHHTASCGYLDIALFLVENGANVNVIDHEGRTQLDLAFETDIVRDSFVWAEATRHLPLKMTIKQFLVDAKTLYDRVPVQSDYLSEHQAKTSVAELLKAHGARRGRVHIPKGLLFQLRLRYPTATVDELTRQCMIGLIESGTDPFEGMHTLIIEEDRQKYSELIALARQKFGHGGPSRPSTAEKPNQVRRNEHVITNKEIEKLTEELLKIGQSGGVGEWLDVGYQRSRYTGGYHHNGLELCQNGPNEVVTDHRTIEIGKRLYEIGGIELMRATYTRIAGKLSLLSIAALADAWEGIGEWRSKAEYPPDY